MDPKFHILLEENNRLLEDNSRRLRRLERRSQVAFWFSMIKWVIVIGATIGFYYYFKPVLDSLTHTYQLITGHSFPSSFSSFFNKP